MVTPFQDRIVPGPLLAAVLACALVLIGLLPVYGDDTAQRTGQAVNKAPATESRANLQSGAKDSYQEDLVAGIRLKSGDGSLVVAPYPRYSPLPDLRRGVRNYTRSMRSIDNSVREMRNNLNRIRTYRRLFR